MQLKAIKDESGIWDIDGLEKWEITFTKMIDDLKSNKPFKFARYGDGEIYCMNGKQGHNCDQHIYFPDLGRALRQSIEAPNYMVGIQPLSVSHIPERVEQYFGHIENLYNADVLHNASIAGKLSKFDKALDGKYLIIVGPPHLSTLFSLDCVHIVISPINCWLEYEQIRQQIEFHIDGVNNAVVLLAASMMSEVIISYFEEYPHTFIDVGSVFDPYCGVKSRRYHHKLKV